MSIYFVNFQLKVALLQKAERSRYNKNFSWWNSLEYRQQFGKILSYRRIPIDESKCQKLSYERLKENCRNFAYIKFGCKPDAIPEILLQAYRKSRAWPASESWMVEDFEKSSSWGFRRSFCKAERWKSGVFHCIANGCSFWRCLLIPF